MYILAISQTFNCYLSRTCSYLFMCSQPEFCAFYIVLLFETGSLKISTFRFKLFMFDRRQRNSILVTLKYYKNRTMKILNNCLLRICFSENDK